MSFDWTLCVMPAKLSGRKKQAKTKVQPRGISLSPDNTDNVTPPAIHSDNTDNVTPPTIHSASGGRMHPNLPCRPTQSTPTLTIPDISLSLEKWSSAHNPL